MAESRSASGTYGLQPANEPRRFLPLRGLPSGLASASQRARTASTCRSNSSNSRSNSSCRWSNSTSNLRSSAYSSILMPIFSFFPENGRDSRDFATTEAFPANRPAAANLLRSGLAVVRFNHQAVRVYGYTGRDNQYGDTGITILGYQGIRKEISNSLYDSDALPPLMVLGKVSQKRYFKRFLAGILPLLVQRLSPSVVLASQKTPRKTGHSILLEERIYNLAGCSESAISDHWYRASALRLWSAEARAPGVAGSRLSIRPLPRQAVSIAY